MAGVKVITKMQAIYRGRLTRLHNNDIKEAIQRLRDERREEAQEAVAVRLQALIRSRHARKRARGLREEWLQRLRDMRFSRYESSSPISWNFR